MNRRRTAEKTGAVPARYDYSPLNGRYLRRKKTSTQNQWRLLWLRIHQYNAIGTNVRCAGRTALGIRVDRNRPLARADHHLPGGSMAAARDSHALPRKSQHHAERHAKKGF